MKKEDPFGHLPRRSVFTPTDKKPAQKASVPPLPPRYLPEAKPPKAEAKPNIVRTRNEGVLVRMEPELLARLDLYRKGLTRPKAIIALLFEHLP
jgi:hypothetical protein